MFLYACKDTTFSVTSRYEDRFILVHFRKMHLICRLEEYGKANQIGLSSKSN